MRYSLPAVFCFFVLFVVLAAPKQSQAQIAKCDPLPKVEWWGQSHAKVIRSVNKSYKGDWSKYIKRWQGYRKRMKKTFEAKSVAVVKSRNLKLQGKMLEDHIKQIDERLTVLECLKTAEAARKARPKTPSDQGKEQVASINDKSLELQVSTKCTKSGIVFQITNLGERWPKLASINIYQVKSKKVVSKRRMKLKNSQQVTFKVPPKKAPKGTEVGIWIEPTWTKRPFKYDAKQTCR